MAAPCHPFREEQAQPGYGTHVEVDETVDFPLVGVCERVEGEYSGVVDQDVYFESFPVDEGSRFLRCVVPGKVEQQAVRLDSVCLGEGAAAFGEFLFLYAHHHYVRSTLGERAAEFKPYSRRAARHERGHSSEVSL